MNNKKRFSGISLTECLLAIFIAAVLCACALPSMLTLLHRMEAKQVSHTLQNLLHSSKVHAYSHHQRIAVCPSQDGISCAEDAWSQGILIFHDLKANRIRDIEEEIIQFIVLDLRYGKLSWRGFGLENHIVFHPESGLPRGSNGSFYYCAEQNQQSLKIVMSAMGHTRVENIDC